MTTTIYIDILFAENFILELFILYITAKINNFRFKLARNAAGALIGALYTCLLYVSGFNLTLKLSFPPILIIIISSVFKIRKPKALFKLFFTYIAVSFILAGGIYFSSEIYGKMNFISILTGIIILTFTGKEIFMLIKSSVLKKEYTKDALIFYNNKIIKLKAFEDTGNFLVDPLSKSSVVIVSKDKIKKIANISDFSNLRNKRLIPCRTIADKFELLYGFKPDKFIYGGKETDAVIAIAKNDFDSENYDAILNPLTLV